MRASVALDDDLIQKAQEFTGVTERTALLRKALKGVDSPGGFATACGGWRFGAGFRGHQAHQG
jgi:hypothetical protein